MADKNEEYIKLRRKDGSYYAVPKDWLQESDWDSKERQIAANKAEADIRNGKTMSREEVLSKFISDDDYSKKDDTYKKLQEEESTLRNRREELSSKNRELEKQLKSESIPKPKSEWTEDDEFESLIGNRPMTYTEKGKQLKTEKDKVWKEYLDVDHKWSDAHEKLILAKQKYANAEREWWEKNKPEYKKGSADKDYRGFATKTKSGYDYDLAQGKGFIAEMSPKEYLQRITYDVFGSTWSSVVSGVNTDNILKYMSMMQQGIKFDMPSIIEGSNQEGRHRAMAAYLLGIEKIPVYVRR